MKRSETYLTNGADARMARLALGLTQGALATRAGLHINSVKRLEHFGRIPRSSWYVLDKVSKQLPLLAVRLPPQTSQCGNSSPEHSQRNQLLDTNARPRAR